MPPTTAPSGGGRLATPSLSDGRPALVLLDVRVRVADNPNDTTAQDLTRKNEPIFASFWPERPPRPSNLFVSCPGAVFVEDPRILCIVDDLILFRVCVGWPFRFAPLKLCDYFIYRADPKRPSLKRLPHPQDLLVPDYEVALLPRGDDHYIIVALVVIPARLNEFRLHLFDSEKGSWTSEMLLVGAPQREFPVEIPWNLGELRSHYTTTVITLGGQGGTVGWVDLWRGILFCDVLRPERTLRGVPLPLPMNYINCNGGMGKSLGNASTFRGIAFVKGRLKLIELHVAATWDPGMDEETGLPWCQVKNWAITSWSNSKMSDSYDDWHKDYTVQSSDIAISNQIMNSDDHSELLPREAMAAQRALQNLHLSRPAPSMNDGEDDVVYLIARVKFKHPKPFVIALDLRNKILKGVAPFCVQRERRGGEMYCPCSISA